MSYGVNGDPLKEGKLDLPELLEEPTPEEWVWARDFVAPRKWREAEAGSKAMCVSPSKASGACSTMLVALLNTPLYRYMVARSGSTTTATKTHVPTGTTIPEFQP